MNESIIRIKNTAADIQLLSSYLKEMYKDTKWNDCLIYFDPNYINYLKKIIDLDSNLFYWLQFENETVGFMHLIARENELYLNNIFLLKSFQGKKLAQKFLYAVIKLCNKEMFTLNVFQSNDIALKWYKKLGMKILENTFFYEVKNSDVYSEDYVTKKDDAGFTSIFINDNKIATVINGKSVMLHDANLMFNFKKYDIVLTRSDQKLTNNALSFWDVSHKMLVSTSTILQNLK